MPAACSIGLAALDDLAPCGDCAAAEFCTNVHWINDEIARKAMPPWFGFRTPSVSP